MQAVEHLSTLFGPVTTYFAKTDTADALVRFTLSFSGRGVGERGSKSGTPALALSTPRPMIVRRSQV